MSNSLNRRTVLKATGGAAVAAATLPALAACSNGKSSSAAAGGSNIGKSLAPWPTYTPSTLVKPDLPGTAAGVQDAFLNYPSNLATAAKGTPGDGSKVTAMIITYGAPPKPADQNRYWAAVNKLLGIDLEVILVADADYKTKFSTMMASGDLPDIMVLGLYDLPNEAEFVQSKCHDLTTFLSGAAGAGSFPNIAATPTFSWDAMGRFDGRIYGVPTHRPLIGPSLFANSDALTTAGVWGKGVKRDDWVKGLTTLNTGGKNAMGTYKGNTFASGYHSGAHGAPNLWTVQGGKFVSQYETEGFKNALAAMADWQKAGLYYPDALTTPITTAKTMFQNGSFLTQPDGYGGYSTYAQNISSFKVDFVRPYDAGVTPTMPTAAGFFGYTVLKKTTDARAKMLLDVMNLLAAPFGTKEYELINYGVEGTHFTRDKAGNPSVKTDLGKVEGKVNLPVTYIAACPNVLYIPGLEDATKRCYQAQQDIVPLSVTNPRYAHGLRSATFSAKGAAMNQLITDAVNDIVTGKRAVSDWDSVVKQYMDAGGTGTKAEYAAALAATA
jgi:putative aldouronate transport system substrate-binding protein